MTIEEAIYCINNFAIYHAKGDLPYSARTLHALEMAAEALEMQIKLKEWIKTLKKKMLSKYY